MATVTFKGGPVQTAGSLPAAGAAAPDFSLCKGDLGTATLKDYAGKNVILNIFPSIDTPTCATSVKTFNEKAAALNNTVVLCVSEDLPFAQGRFCGAEGIKNVETLSSFRSPDFGKTYGTTIESAPLNGLHSRAIVVIDAKGTVKHSEHVAEIANEPNYDAALKALS
jgi:thiol peroxidase